MKTFEEIKVFMNNHGADDISISGDYIFQIYGSYTPQAALHYNGRAIAQLEYRTNDEVTISLSRADNEEVIDYARGKRFKNNSGVEQILASFPEHRDTQKVVGALLMLE